ncbi:hypothetical protein HG530_013513 [Fusarium avenaceum]|nr:hypothetical protein HG530_013513 [Fusarium avenaceum]
MDTLPTEILIQILDNIPSSASKQARLTSRAFNVILSKRTFEVLISFLNPVFAQNTVLAIARDPQVRLRRSSIWSPRCSVPQKLPVDESFLMALWVGLHGTSWAAERAAHGETLDVYREVFSLEEVSSGETSDGEEASDGVHSGAGSLDRDRNIGAGRLMVLLGV